MPDEITTLVNKESGNNVYPNIKTENIPDDGITTAKIADNAITYGKIGNSQIIEPKIAGNAISSAKIQNSAVTTTKIANQAVTTLKIEDGAVTALKIADGSIVEQHIAPEAVTNGKIAYVVDTLDNILTNINGSTPTSIYELVSAFKILTGKRSVRMWWNVGSDEIGGGFYFSIYKTGTPVQLFLEYLQYNDITLSTIVSSNAEVASFMSNEASNIKVEYID